MNPGETIEKAGDLRDAITDGIADVLYYNRKQDDELTVADVKELITSGAVTTDQLVEWASEAVREAVRENFPDAK